MTARNVIICSDDGHPIFDVISGRQINYRDVFILKIRNHVWLGNGVIVMSQSEIGKNSMIGAGSFVRNKNSPNNCMIGGNPARILRKNIVWNRATVQSIKDIDPQFIELTNEEGDKNDM